MTGIDAHANRGQRRYPGSLQIPLRSRLQNPNRYAPTTENNVLKKIVSGGQTGVDRGALDSALERGFPCGGWCPSGRRAEDGSIPPHYPVKELSTGAYLDRTRRNIEDSDGTLIVCWGQPADGTRDTLDYLSRLSKPRLVVNPNHAPSLSTIRAWIAEYGIQILNVAGPRESVEPGIQKAAARLIGEILDAST